MQWQTLGNTLRTVWSYATVAVGEAAVLAAKVVVGRRGHRREHHPVHDSQLLPQGLNAASLTFMADRIDYVETCKCIFQMIPLHLCVSAHSASTNRRMVGKILCLNRTFQNCPLASAFPFAGNSQC